MMDNSYQNQTKQTTREGNYTGTFRILWFLLAILLLSLVSGCSNHSNQSAQTNLRSNSRLIAIGDGLCQDTKTGKMWQVESSKTLKSLAAAQNYTESLKTGGYQDWRLPTVAELYDLYIIFDLHENGNCSLQAEGTYWSDEEDLMGRVGSWELDDNCDPEREFIPKKKGMVRAIRI